MILRQRYGKNGSAITSLLLSLAQSKRFVADAPNANEPGGWVLRCRYLETGRVANPELAHHHHIWCEVLAIESSVAEIKMPHDISVGQVVKSSSVEHFRIMSDWLYRYSSVKIPRGLQVTYQRERVSLLRD